LAVVRGDNCVRTLQHVLLWNLRKPAAASPWPGADIGYTGKLTIWAQGTLHLGVAIIRRREAHTFQVLPRHWVVERTFAWISKCRRTVRDYDRLSASHEGQLQDR
jgi:transposase